MFIFYSNQITTFKSINYFIIFPKYSFSKTYDEHQGAIAED